ncbi:MAG: hypothetical protein KDC44_07110 [Phaeodactylibacter sp.]|nr:hypothetical protein [Phaeodactylibacter sp.]
MSSPFTRSSLFWLGCLFLFSLPTYLHAQFGKNTWDQKLMLKVRNGETPIKHGQYGDGQPVYLPIYYRSIDTLSAEAQKVDMDPSREDGLISTAAFLQEDTLWLNPADNAFQFGENVVRYNTFYVVLPNQGEIDAPIRYWSFAPMIIPFKYRFSYNYTKDFDGEVFRVPTDLSFNLNANLFAGYTIGKKSYRYQKGQHSLNKEKSITPGIFLGVSQVTLNADNTRSNLTPLDRTVRDASINAGFGAMVNFNTGLEVALVLGWDVLNGGSADSYWDHAKYNNSPFVPIPWVGLGIAYKVGYLN